MRVRSLVLSAIVGVGLLFGSSTTASAGLFHRRASCCYTPCYYYCYTPCYYTYSYTLYKIWHVYKTDPATGAPKIVARYLTPELANADPNVVNKTAYVQEESYYAP